MKYKKILIIALIALIAIVLVGSVQAQSDVTKTTIRGIDFNVPNDFEVYSCDLDSVSDTGLSTTDTYIYKDSNNDISSIMVIEFNDANGLDHLLNEQDDGEKTTINGHEGYLSDDDVTGGVLFKYIDGKCLVEVSAQSMTQLEKIII